MSDTWINHGVYPLLERIGNFHIYFGKVAVWIAAICLLMTLGMAVVKIFLGITDAREQVIKMGVSVCLYFILMYVYPLAMKAVLPFAMNLGYGAVFGTSSSQSINGKFSDLSGHGGSKASFYKWVGENTGDIFSSKTGSDAKAQDVQVALNMNIIDATTGYVDLNKFLLYVVAFLKIGFHALPKITLLQLDINLILACFCYFLAVIVAVVCMLVCVIQYVMALLDYFSLFGFGILMIPLSLWDGTKSYTEKLYGSIGSIIIKLIVISAFLCLSVIEMVDFFVEVYLSFLDVGLVFTLSDSLKLVELSVTLLFKGFLIAVLTMQTSKIAGFLNGGSPSMSFGEAAIGAGQTAMMAGGAYSLSKGVVNQRGNTGTMLDKMAGSFNASRKMGGSVGESFKSSMATAGTQIGTSLKNGVKSLPGAIKSGASSLAGMANLGNGISSEGFGGIGNRGFGSGNFGGGSGGRSMGSSGGGGSTGSSSSQGQSGGHQDYRSMEFQNKDGSAKDNSGLDSVYGMAETSQDEKGNSTYDSKADEMIGKAGQLATSESYLERKKGAVIGMAGSIMKSMDNARSERLKGNVMGNSSLQAMGRGALNGLKGVSASRQNSGTGMHLRFNRDSAVAKANGSTKLQVRANSRDSVDYSKGTGKIEKSPYGIKQE